MENGKVDKIRDVFIALFASIPYTTAKDPFEHDFQTVLFITFTLLGRFVKCESHTYLGRIDCVLETENFVYIFEFKRDESADNALQQIEDMHYAEPYIADRRKLYRIGVCFDSDKRQISDWKVVS